MITKARSSNGKLVAVYDATGYYLADGRGKNARKLKVLVDWDREDTEVGFSFNKAGTLLAVMAGGWYGEPHVNSASQLWSVDTKSGRARKMGEYGDCLLGSNRIVEVGHRLGPWSEDGKSIQVIADRTEVIDGVAETRDLGTKEFWVRLTE